MYRFWMFGTGAWSIDLLSAGQARALTSATLGPAWGPGQSHTVVGICSANGTVADLQMLVDGKSVLQTTDKTLTGPFRAGYVIDGPAKIDIQRFTVSTSA